MECQGLKSLLLFYHIYVCLNDIFLYTLILSKSDTFNLTFLMILSTYKYSTNWNSLSTFMQ